jgi:hypothetical protein
MDLAAWLASIFDHPAEGPEWYRDPHAVTRDPEPAECVRLLGGLLEQPASQLARYSDGQLARGLWFLVDNACSSYALALLAPEVEVHARLRCIEAVPRLFREVFQARCRPLLSHLDTQGESPLNTTCYMWWDLFPSWGVPGRDVDTALLAAMTAILEIDSLACQESALHGLGHWRASHPQRVEEAIDRYLKRAHPPDELRRYAVSAREGCIQ